MLRSPCSADNSVWITAVLFLGRNIGQLKPNSDE
jgi:hypothetical protein